MEKKFLVNSLIVALLLVIAGGPATVTGQGATGGGVVIGEAGEVNIADFDWHLIAFENTYTSTPVVIATVVTANNGDNNGLIPTISSVNTTHFRITLCQDAGASTCDTTYNQETVNYFVFDVGKAQGYDWIDVGTLTVTTAGADTTLNYKKTFENVPVIWTTPQTYSQNGNIAAVVWVEDAANKLTTSAPLIGCVHQAPANSADVNYCTTGQPSETVGYVAIDTANVEINAFQTGYADISDSTWTAATFSPGYTNPLVMVTQNDDDGGQDPQYPWARNVVSTGMDFRYCEQDIAGICDYHTDEVVNWFAVEKGDITVGGPGVFENVEIDNYDDTKPALDVYQAVNNSPYGYKYDAVSLLVEAGNKTNPLGSILIIRNWGNDTYTPESGAESKLRFDSGAWDSSYPDDFSYMQAAIYTKGNDQILRLKPGPLLNETPVLGQLRVLNNDKAFITQVVAAPDKAASLTFVETTDRDFGNETASIYRPANTSNTSANTSANPYDLRVYMAHVGDVMVFKGNGSTDEGNVGIGAMSPKTKLEVSSVIRTTPTDNPGNCNADSEGGMYYDASMNEPCFCDEVNWRQFDGGGNCS